MKSIGGDEVFGVPVSSWCEGRGSTYSGGMLRVGRVRRRLRSGLVDEQEVVEEREGAGELSVLDEVMDLSHRGEQRLRGGSVSEPQSCLSLDGVECDAKTCVRVDHRSMIQWIGRAVKTIG